MWLKRTLAGVSAVALLALSAGAVTAQTTPIAMKEGVSAVVNDEIISTYDLRQRTLLLIISSGSQPTAQAVEQIQREALRGLIDEHLQMQEIHKVEQKQKMNLSASDKEVDSDIGALAQQNGLSTEQLIGSLTAAGVNVNTLRDQFRAESSWRRYIGARYSQRVSIGDDQVSNALKRIAADAAKPQYLMSEVFIDAQRAGGQKQAMDGANQLIDQLQKGAPFAAVARQFSSAPTAANGGEVGWVAPGQVQPVLAKALEEMRPGQLSAPIPTTEGVYILQLRDKRSGADSTMVDLKQAAIRLTADATPDQIAAATTSLEGLRSKVKDCKALDTEAAKVTGVVAGDLGEADVKDLSPEFRDVVGTLKVGEVSKPVRTSAGLHLVALCGRHANAADAPSRDDVENRLVGESLSMIARRELRDLRNSANIESR